MNLTDLIKSFEGLRLTAYFDDDGVLTIGYGHTGKDVYQGQVISEAEADTLLAEDIAAAQKQTLELCPSLAGNQLDAITDFLFNEGYSRLEGSTLRKCVLCGDLDQVPDELDKWIYGNHVVLPGLAARRAAEIELWNTP